MSLQKILFDMDLFPNESERASSQKRVLILLQALTWCDQLYLREHPETPLIYQSDVKYIVPEQYEKASLPEVATVRDFLAKKDAPDDIQQAFKLMADQLGAGEHFREISQILKNGGGDCDNVASWRAAELRELGIMARPYITWRKRPDGGTTYHVIVLWPDGSSEDPSLLLGMGGEDRVQDRAEEERKNQERMGDFLAGVRESGRAQHVLGAGAITTPQDFNQLEYQPTFWTDDAYEDWSPTRPQAYYYNPLYPGGLIKPGGGPLFNTLMRDPDDDDRFDGVASTPHRRRQLARKLRLYKRAA